MNNEYLRLKNEFVRLSLAFFISLLYYDKERR